MDQLSTDRINASENQGGAQRAAPRDSLKRPTILITKVSGELSKDTETHLFDEEQLAIEEDGAEIGRAEMIECDHGERLTLVVQSRKGEVLWTADLLAEVKLGHKDVHGTRLITKTQTLKIQ